MADAPAQVYDLRAALPTGWTQAGLSAPKSDGVNLYRTPTAAQTTLSFTAPAGNYVQYRYQLYSPSQGVTGRVSLNGQPLDTFTFPVGQFQNREASGFARAGINTLTIDLSCGVSACALPAVQQYWTQLSVVSARAPVTSVGLGVERWWLDAPSSLLSVTGTGPLRYDNVNFLRYLTRRELRLSWPAGTRVIDASLQIAADQPFRATFLADGTAIKQIRGDASSTAAPTLSLVSRPGTTALSVKVDCLRTPALPCARVYFARVSAVPPSVAAPPTVSQLALGGVVLLLLLASLLMLLRLPVRRAT